MKVIVIHIPGCNVNWLGAYGNEWVRTPHLDRLASESVVFDQHHSCNPDPDAVEDAWHSGDYLIPAAPEGERAFDDRLAQLAQRGIPCVRISDGGEAFEEAAGWDHIQVASGEIVDAAIDAMEQLAEHDSWLLWLDATRFLPPWEVFDELFDEYVQDWIPPESFEEVPEIEEWPDPPIGPFDSKDIIARERLERTFASVVTALDLEIGGLLEEIRERRLDQGVCWIVTSGYGWPLGEHDTIGPHVANLHEESVHVPLILRLPDGSQAGRRVNALTQNVDVLPTLLDLFGIPGDGLHGQSVLPLARGERSHLREYAIFARQIGEQIEWGMRSQNWCFQLTQSSGDSLTRLYEKPADRWEVNNLRQQHLDWTDQLQAMIEQFAAASVVPGTPTWPPMPNVQLEEPPS